MANVRYDLRLGKQVLTGEAAIWFKNRTRTFTSDESYSHCEDHLRADRRNAYSHYQANYCFEKNAPPTGESDGECRRSNDGRGNHKPSDPERVGPRQFANE